MEDLYQLRYTLMKSKYEVVELQKRILFNKPTENIYTQAISIIEQCKKINELKTNDDDENDPFILQRNLDYEEKQLEMTMTNLMVDKIQEAEKKIQHIRDVFNRELDKVPIRTETNLQGLDSKAIDIFYCRLNLINKILDCKSQFRTNYYLRYHYESLDKIVLLKKIRFAPTFIMHTHLHLLNNEQIELLNRGPTYIPVCQLYTIDSSLSNSIIRENRLKDHFKLLQHDLSCLYGKFHINTAQAMFLNKEIKQLYLNFFSNYSLPIHLQQRALYEYNLVESIRKQLQTYDLILRRTANQRNQFYLGNRRDFEEKSNDYMKQTNQFQCCHEIDNENLQVTHDYLKQQIRFMNEKFDSIFQDKKKYRDLYNSIYIDVDKVDLPYLYFLPNISSVSSMRIIYLFEKYSYVSVLFLFRIRLNNQ